MKIKQGSAPYTQNKTYAIYLYTYTFYLSMAYMSHTYFNCFCRKFKIDFKFIN